METLFDSIKSYWVWLTPVAVMALWVLEKLSADFIVKRAKRRFTLHATREGIARLDALIKEYESKKKPLDNNGKAYSKVMSDGYLIKSNIYLRSGDNWQFGEAVSTNSDVAIKNALGELEPKKQTILLGEAVGQLARSRNYVASGLLILSGSYVIFVPSYNPWLGGALLILSAVLMLDCGIMWLRYRAGTYGDTLQEVGEVVEFLRKTDDCGGPGGGRYDRLYPEDIERKRAVREETIHAGKGAEVWI